MSEHESIEPLPDTGSRRTDVKHRTRPASQWCEQVERSLAELSSQRRELRQQMATQREERRAHNPHGEESLSLRTAHQLAKSSILGEGWRRAVQGMKQAGQRVRSQRRQQDRFLTEKRLVQQRSATWTYRIFKAPYLAWKAHPIKSRLRQADLQRREALKVLQGLRGTASVPEVRARILELTESLLVGDERLKHSIRALHETDRSISAEISRALQLAPQLRALGERPVTMEQRVDSVTRELAIPKPLKALVPDVAAQARKPKVRLA